MKNDHWDPKQYHKFQSERSRPFNDLVGLLKAENKPKIIDLGCGTGELTAKLHDTFQAESSLGLDSSESMLKEAKHLANGSLAFQNADVQDFQPTTPYDIVFSNAALQWIPNHELLFPKVLSWVAPQGQIAIQMPCNYDHVSHRLSWEVYKDLFPKAAADETPKIHILDLARYAEILHQQGFREQTCEIRVYGLSMPSGSMVLEWTKGTLLSGFRRLLSPNEYEDFYGEYSKRLLSAIGSGPYYYAFKRMLLWARRY